MKQLSPILLVLAVGVGLTYLFWGPLWEGGGFVGGDVYSYYLPQKAVYQEALQRGELALWNDRVAQGYPQLAESQTGVLYPLHLVLYAALDLNTAYHVSHLVHYVLAFCGMALLARTLGLTLNGALLAGLVYAYGWFPSRTCWEWAIVGGAWLPLALWCGERFAATRLWRYAIGLSAVLGVQMLAGHFLIAFMTQLMVAAFLPCRLWWLPGKRLATTESGRQGATLLVGGIAVACGFGLAAAQLLPTWELKQRSQRADVNDAHDVAYGYLPPEYLGQIVMPWRYYLMPSHERDAALLAMTKPTPEARTNQAEAHLYFGLLPVILLAVGLLWRDPAEGLAGRRKVFWWGVALLSLSYTPGWWLPLTRHLPGFSFFEGPGRFGLITTLAVGLLAADGADRLAERLGRSGRPLLWGLVWCLTAADLFWVSRQVTYSPMVAQPAVKTLDDSPIRRMLAVEPEPVRLYAPGQNLPTLLGVSAVPQYLGLCPREYFESELQMPVPPEMVEDRGVLAADAEFIAWLRQVGVTHVLQFAPLSQEWPAELIWNQPDPFLNRAWGRAPHEPVYLSRLTDAPGRNDWEDRATGTSVQTLNRSNGRIELEVETADDNVLVLAELLYPGWRVEVDGAAAEALAVRGGLRGVEVPAGRHTIAWIFEPVSLYWGLGVSAGTLLLLAAVAHVRFWHPQRLAWLSPESPAGPQSPESDTATADARSAKEERS